jgi:hypothetical protein
VEDRGLRAGGWQLAMPRNLSGATLGLAGLGRLGSAMVAPARVFGMDVIAWSQNLTGERAAALGVDRVTLDDLLARSDVLSIHLVLSERTRGLLGAAELAKMKPTAALVNTSRGPIVQERALIDALRDGTIAGAGLGGLRAAGARQRRAASPPRVRKRADLPPHVRSGGGGHLRLPGGPSDPRAELSGSALASHQATVWPR